MPLVSLPAPPSQLVANWENSDSSSIIVIASKTIFVQQLDDEYRPIDSFTKAFLESDNDIKDILGKKVCTIV